MSFIEKYKKEKYLLQSIGIAMILASCHWIQYYRSGLMIQPLIRAVFTTVYIPFVLITGFRYIRPFFLVFAMSILYWNRFTNYTSFIMVLIAIGDSKKTKIPYLCVYSIGVFISLFLYRDSFTHLIIHAGGCYVFYLAYMLLGERRIINIPLELTKDEENILMQLVEGKELKEIEGFSQNTIYTKLREARIRNGMKRNCQLVERYAEQIQKK